MNSSHKKLSRSHSHHTSSNHTNHGEHIKHNHEFSELVTNIGDHVRSKVRLQQQLALEKLANEKRIQGNKMDWLQDTDSVFDHDDEVPFYGVKEKEYDDIKDTFITLSKEKHHLLFEEEKGYQYSTKSKSPIKLKPLRKLLGIENDSLDLLQSDSLISESIISGYPANYDKSISIYDDDPEVILQPPPIKSKAISSGSIGSFDRYSTYLNEVSQISPKIEDKYFGTKSKLHFYATYTELDRKKNIMLGGCSSLSSFVKEEKNSISQSISTFLDNGIISAPPSSRNHPLPTDRTELKQKSSVIEEESSIAPEPVIIEKIPDEFLFDFYIVSCAHLMKADIMGTSDPTVKVFFNDVYVAETACIKNSLHPVWDEMEKFEIHIPAGMKVRDCKLDLEVFDLDKFDEPDFLGSTTFQGRDLIHFIKSESGKHTKIRGSKLTNQRSYKLGISPKYPERDLVILDHLRVACSTIQTQISTFNDQILNNEDDDSTTVTLTVEPNLGFENKFPEINDNVEKDESTSLEVPSLNLNDNDDMSDFNYRLVIDPQHDTEPKEVKDFIDDSFTTFAPKSPRAQFLVGCLANSVPPTTVGLLRKRISNTINLAHMTLGDKLATLFAECIEGIPTVESLILRDNNLSHVSLTVIMSKIQCLLELKILDISCNNLGPKASGLLQQYISSPTCPLKCLVLQDINLDDVELSRFVNAFKENSRLEEIDLSKNLLGRDETKYISPDFVGAGVTISELLTNSTMKLRRLNLEFNSLHSENSLILCESVSFNTSLQYLNLSMNPIGREGAISLAKSLLMTKTLEELLLSTCNIDCVGCFSLVINSKECPTLKYLNLDSNLIGEEGGRAILHVISHCSNRLNISCAMSDMNVSSPEDIIFKRKNIINTYSLDLSNVYERAIAFHVLDLVACDPHLGFRDFIYKDIEGNEDELILIKGSSTDQESDGNEISNLIELKKDLMKVRKVFRKVDTSGWLDQSMFLDFLTRLNIKVSKVDAAFANFTLDPNDNVKKINENEAVNFVVYLSNQALAVYENCKQETIAMGMCGPNKIFSRYIPPSEGTLLMTINEEIVISRKYGIVTTKAIESMTKLALESKNPLQTLLYVVDSNYFYFNEAKDLVGVLKKQTGDICLTLSYILPKMILSKDARRLVNFYIKDDKSKQATLQKLIGASYLIIIGIRDGYYSLDLSKPLDRQAIELLLAHSQSENEKRKLVNKWDISQYMQWNGFRNVYLNGEHLVPHQSFFSLLPRSGKMDFDYIDIARPDSDLIPLDDEHLISLMLQSGIISSLQIEWAREKLTWMATSSNQVFDDADLLQVNNIIKKKEVGVPIGAIIINLISCSNLENKDKGPNGLSDPFVVMSILDKSVESKHITNNLNPVFNERFEIEWDGISQLLCNVWDEDFTKGNDPLGNLRIALASLGFNNKKKIKINRNLESASGKIMMELEFQPAVDPIGTIVIHLISCNNLVGMDNYQEEKGRGTSDPFVVMSLGLKRRESKHIFNCLDPIFNETFELEWDGISPLYCQVWDDDFNSFDDPLGDILVDLCSLKAKPTGTICVKHKKLEKIKSGTITMDISFKPRWKPIGKLSMKYISCNDLENRDGLHGISDPYLVFRCGPNRIHTKVQMNTLNPVFDGIYDLEWDGKEPLLIEIWDSDNNGADDSLGEIKIDVQYFNFHYGKRAMKILNKKLNRASWGKITMDIFFYPSVAAINSNNENRNDIEFVEDNTRALSMRKNLEKLLEPSEFQKRKEKWKIVEKKEQNLLLTTTEVTIDGDMQDEYYSVTETAELPSLLNPDGLSSPTLSNANTPKIGSPQSPDNINRMSINEGSTGTPSANLSRKTMNESVSGSPQASPKTKVNEIEVTVEHNCSNTLLKLQALLEPRLLLSRHIALILQAFIMGQTARSNYGSYRVELIIFLLHCIVDLHNFGLILNSLNPREHAQIIVRMGYLSIFNPFQPQGYYFFDHRQWDHRQMMKILLLINVLEPDSSSFNNMIFKEITDDKSIHDAIPNNPHNDHDLAHPDIVPLTEQIIHVTDLSPWHDEHSFPTSGTLSLNFLCSNASSELSEMHSKRFQLLPLLLIDHDEILRTIDTSLPILFDSDDIYSYRQVLSDEIKTRDPSTSRRQNSHASSTNHENIPSSTETATSPQDEVGYQDEENYQDARDAIFGANEENPIEEANYNNAANEDVPEADKTSAHDGIKTGPVHAEPELEPVNDDNIGEEIERSDEEIERSDEEIDRSDEEIDRSDEEIERSDEITADVSSTVTADLSSIIEEKVQKYARSSVDQLNTYLQMKTELKWLFTFIDLDGDGILDEDEDGFEI